MIPIYRAKRVDSDEYVEGFLKNCTDTGLDTFWIQDINFIDYKIDINTLSINFPDMLDCNKQRIFASLQGNGKGGDIVISKSYPFYGDAPEIINSSGRCEELNYKGLLLFGSNGCFIYFLKVSNRVRGNVIGHIIEDFNKYEIIGIQK